MANKRMFSKKIMQSDAFLSLNHSAQALYVQLNMEADDDGFVNNPKMIQRITGATETDMQQLISMKFVISIDNLIVIKHWKINNYIPGDRYHETTYKDVKEALDIDENGAYRLVKQQRTSRKQSVYKTVTECLQNEDPDKIRLDKNRIDKGRPASADPGGLSILNIPEEIKENFDTFLEMRKEKKKPITKDSELKLLLNRLQRLSNGNFAIMNQMLENATLSKWTSVYELKPEELAKFNKKKIATFEAPVAEVVDPLSPEERDAKIREMREKMGAIFGGVKA